MHARSLARRPPRPEDRRLARSAATRAAVVEALLALLEAGDAQPSMPRIAAHAGVSLRSVFQHFADREALYAAAAERQQLRIAAFSPPLATAAPLAARVAALAAQRARVFEMIAPVRRAALLLAPFSPAIARRLTALRAAQRAEVLRLFAAELRGMEASLRRARTAALLTVCGFSSWQVLRAHQGLGARAARRAVEVAVLALLAPPAAAGRRSPRRRATRAA